jgi:hypothetical protein
MNFGFFSKSLGSLAPAVALSLCLGCSDSDTTGANTQVVVDPFPLSVGNRWEYSLEMRVSFIMEEDNTLFTYSATGSQVVTVSRTEVIDGEESYGLLFNQVTGRFFDPESGLDTTLEVQYYIPRKDRVILKAIEGVYGTGGLMIQSKSGTEKRYGTLIGYGGSRKFVTLERLAFLLMNAAGGRLLPGLQSSPELASDGLQNRDGAFIYESDYLYLFNELFKGKSWTSIQAQGGDGLTITQKVTNVLSELSGYEGPVAEVEVNNSYIDLFGGTSYKQRNYYKPGVGLLQSEISDSDFDFFTPVDNNTAVKFVGTGLWEVVKKLTRYEIK